MQLQPPAARAAGDSKLQSVLVAYLGTGLLFMLLPGTFLGVWNLLSISSDRSAATLSPAWIQAHGHAQIFGWIGTFIIGIGYYSLTKMGAVAPFAAGRAWASWALWTLGVALRWIANISLWNWRELLPVSAALELAAFLIFFRTVSSHKSSGAKRSLEPWMLLVIGSTFGFLLLLLFNLGLALAAAATGDSPAFPHSLDQRFLVLATWGFPVLAIWGFNARWLPAFVGLKPASSKALLSALAVCAAGVASAMAGGFRIASALLMVASILAIAALNIATRAQKPAKVQGIHSSFPVFIRLCYVWLAVAAGLSMWAASADTAGGIWGASRHSLTVGFLAGMIFAIGPRILPAFAGGKQLFSPALMLVSCSLLNLGCLLRVSSEIPAYEKLLHGAALQTAWHVLPCSAIVELAAVTVFALNLALTMLRPAAPVADKRLYSISFEHGPKLT
jgi:uncharacterized protein involved in response to NO